MYGQIRLQAVAIDYLGIEGFHTILYRALEDLCERFRGAERLGRPFVAWELMEVTERRLSGLCDTSVLASELYPFIPRLTR